MACPSLNYTIDSSSLGSGGVAITITAPEIYKCTNIQIRFRAQNGSIIEDWFDYAVLSNLVTNLSFAPPDGVCSIDTRLSQCCGGDGGGGGGEPPVGPPSDEPPCLAIGSSVSECSTTKVVITNPYKRPTDTVATPYNDIYIPKQTKLTITQNSCADIQAKLCTIRCPEPPPAVGACPCSFMPSIDIQSLPQIQVSNIRLPYGVPIDIDVSCNSSNYRARPEFNEPRYTKIEAILQPLWGTTPFIDNVGYKISDINTNTWVKVYTASTAQEMRQWLKDHFKFLTIDETTMTVRSIWPYTDLYWTPYDSCVSNPLFTPEAGTVYVKLIPC